MCPSPALSLIDTQQVLQLHPAPQLAQAVTQHQWKEGVAKSRSDLVTFAPYLVMLSSPQEEAKNHPLPCQLVH